MAWCRRSALGIYYDWRIGGLHSAWLAGSLTDDGHNCNCPENAAITNCRNPSRQRTMRCLFSRMGTTVPYSTPVQHLPYRVLCTRWIRPATLNTQGLLRSTAQAHHPKRVAPIPIQMMDLPTCSKNQIPIWPQSAWTHTARMQCKVQKAAK